MNEQELNEIEERAAKATPGPWKTVGFFGAMEILDSTSTYLDNTDDNANFIAHARQDVPALVAEVRRLTEENLMLKGILKSTADYLENEAMKIFRKGGAQ